MTMAEKKETSRDGRVFVKKYKVSEYIVEGHWRKKRTR